MKSKTRVATVFIKKVAHTFYMGHHEIIRDIICACLLNSQHL